MTRKKYNDLKSANLYNEQRGKLEPWPGEVVDVSVEHRVRTEQVRVKTWLIVGLASLFAGLLVVLACYAMWTANSVMLEQITRFVLWGLVAVLGWAIGATVLKLLSKVRLDE